MNVLLINGSPNEKRCSFTALSEIANEFEPLSITSEIVHIGKAPVRGCVACMGCMKSNNGHCVFDDDITNSLIDKMNAADAIIIASPVYYSGIAGSLKCFLDRAFWAGRGLDNKLAASVISSRRAGSIAAFDEINHYYLKSNMHVVGSTYWNEVHGFSAKDVAQDLEGLQTLRTLAKNMAWLLKCIEIADKSGLSRPEYESVITTNFIR